MHGLNYDPLFWTLKCAENRYRDLWVKSKMPLWILDTFYKTYISNFKTRLNLHCI